jgi:hypothetical protein
MFKTFIGRTLDFSIRIFSEPSLDESLTKISSNSYLELRELSNILATLESNSVRLFSSFRKEKTIETSFLLEAVFI